MMLRRTVVRTAFMANGFYVSVHDVKARTMISATRATSGWQFLQTTFGISLRMLGDLSPSVDGYVPSHFSDPRIAGHTK